MIIYNFDSNGGFTACNTETGLSAYAYPTSDNATQAKREPDTVACAMMANEENWTNSRFVEKDAANCARLTHPAPA